MNASLYNGKNLFREIRNLTVVISRCQVISPGVQVTKA